MKLSNKTNLLHLFFLSLLATTYVFPLIIIGQVTVYPHDNLDGGFVLDHIISKIYRGDFDSVSYLLGGTIKWYYLEKIDCKLFSHPVYEKITENWTLLFKHPVS